MSDKGLVSSLKDANDLVKLITGKSIPDLARRSAELFGKDVARRLVRKEPEEPEDSPYKMLGIRRDASSLVVKASYRALIKGVEQDSAEYEKLHRAYLKILCERNEG